ncbi:MAG: beta-phosphoglucomutase [Tissierellales bacterium]|nr:beta-phosphoglucomutase [Tissierellales bacterium]
MIDFDGIVFDLDGVITETSIAHFIAWKELANEMGFDIPDEVMDKVRGIPRMEALDIVLSYNKNIKVKDIKEKEKLANRKNQIYLNKILHYNESNLNEGVIELFEFLKKHKKRIALASSSLNAKKLLKVLKIEKYFDAVVDPTSIKQGKPAPDIFLKACILLDLPPNKCVGVEDSQAGIESIIRAGLTPIGIGENIECEIKFKNIKEFYEFLTKHSID